MPQLDGSASVEPVLAPVSPIERIVTLDVLRGIALFGVLLANIWLWFSGTIFQFPELNPQLSRLSLDTVAFMLVATLVSGKAISTFSFLFGLGFAVQMMRAESKGLSVVPVYARRLAILLLIGITHAVLLWYGDILATYALLGFVLLLFRNRTERTILTWAVALVVLVPLAMGTMAYLRHPGPAPGAETPTAETGIVDAKGSDSPVVGTPEARNAESDAVGTPSATSADSPAAGTAGAKEPSAEASGANADDPDAADRALLADFTSGDYDRIVSGNLVMLERMYRPPRGLRKFWLLGLFLFGLWAGRRRIFEHTERHRKLLIRLMIWGFPVGLVGTLAETAMHVNLGSQAESLAWFPLAMAVIEVFATAPFAFAYIAAATLLLERRLWQRLLAPFAPVGRMALTNYVAQTLICLAIYIGLGLMAQVGGHALGILISCAIFGAQMILSAWWLRRFRFGPLEWLWRSATYGRIQPMRLMPQAPVGVEQTA